MYIPYSTRITQPLYRLDHECTETYCKNIVVVDNNGLQHDEVIRFCKCEDEGTTLVRFGLWPSSPQQPRIAFQFSMLEMQRILQMEAHVPLHAFCKVLKQLNAFLPESLVVSYFFVLY